jgi:hypothetical protein
MTALAVYETIKAPPGWLHQLLQPVVDACRFQSAPPLEVRPTGNAGGYCQSSDLAHDRRVMISKKVVFWSNETAICVYLHEAAHRLLDVAEVDDHGPEFFCLQAILLTRSTQFFRRDPLFCTDLYDLQDEPAELNEAGWRGIVLNWSLLMAAELAATELSAEQLADEVCIGWRKFVEEREAARKQAEQQRLAARKNQLFQREEKERLQSAVTLWRALSFIGCSTIFLMFYLR